MSGGRRVPHRQQRQEEGTRVSGVPGNAGRLEGGGETPLRSTHGHAVSTPGTRPGRAMLGERRTRAAEGARPRRRRGQGDCHCPVPTLPSIAAPQASASEHNQQTERRRTFPSEPSVRPGHTHLPEVTWNFSGHCHSFVAPHPDCHPPVG